MLDMHAVISTLSVCVVTCLFWSGWLLVHFLGKLLSDQMACRGFCLRLRAVLHSTVESDWTLAACCLHILDSITPSTCPWLHVIVRLWTMLLIHVSPVPQPPTITQQSPKDYIFDPRENIVIHCEAKGKPHPRWDDRSSHSFFFPFIFLCFSGFWGQLNLEPWGYMNRRSNRCHEDHLWNTPGRAN